MDEDRKVKRISDAASKMRALSELTASIRLPHDETMYARGEENAVCYKLSHWQSVATPKVSRQSSGCWMWTSPRSGEEKRSGLVAPKGAFSWTESFLEGSFVQASSSVQPEGVDGVLRRRAWRHCVVYRG